MKITWLHEMKRIIAIILSVTIFMMMAAGCGQEPAQDEITPDTETEETEDLTEPEEPAEPETPEPEARFEFQPKVSSVYLEEVFGKEMVDTWYNVVDAVMKGEDTFECPDKFTYDWVMGQFPERCFPVLTELISSGYADGYKDGVGHIVYLTSREEFDEKMKDFQDLVEDILNKTMKPEYTDFEKALSLFEYVVHNTTYDQETYELMYEEYTDYMSAYRFLTTWNGVCQEISAGYSYLLNEAGVDATVMMGGNHQWSYIRIDGKNYHIDPTYALNNPDRLEFFMMDDEKRSEDFSPDECTITSNYSQDHEHPDYVADDDTYSKLWYKYLDSFDHDTHTMKVYTYNEEEGKTYEEISY